MMKYEIDIEGLPEGWRPMAYRKLNDGEFYLFNRIIWTAENMKDRETEFLIIEKIQPRRIVIDLTEEEYCLLLSIPIEQRLLRNPAMLDLIEKIQAAKFKENEGGL